MRKDFFSQLKTNKNYQMKGLLLPLLFLVFSSNVKSQSTFSNFNLKDGVIKYERVYEIDGETEQQLIDKLNGYLPSVSGLRDVVFNGNVFTGRIERDMVDYQKYGGKRMSTWIPLNYPMNGIFTIQIKENRYRLLITDIETKEDEFSQPVRFNFYLTKNKGTSFTSNKTMLNGMEFVDKFLFDKFNILNKTEDDW
jgi:hypothetical protein